MPQILYAAAWIIGEYRSYACLALALYSQYSYIPSETCLFLTLTQNSTRLLSSDVQAVYIHASFKLFGSWVLHQSTDMGHFENVSRQYTENLTFLKSAGLLEARERVYCVVMLFLHTLGITMSSDTPSTL